MGRAPECQKNSRTRTKRRPVTTVPFGRITAHFIPYLLRAARIAPGMRVLDIAAGTGRAAEAALTIVGATGHVTAADLSPAMVEKSRKRLGHAKNASVAVENGQALSFPDRSFDAVV